MVVNLSLSVSGGMILPLWTCVCTACASMRSEHRLYMYIIHIFCRLLCLYSLRCFSLYISPAVRLCRYYSWPGRWSWSAISLKLQTCLQLTVDKSINAAQRLLCCWIHLSAFSEESSERGRTKAVTFKSVGKVCSLQLHYQCVERESQTARAFIEHERTEKWVCTIKSLTQGMKKKTF